MKTAEERFWNLVDKNGPYCEKLNSRCWIWKGSKTNGYGIFWPTPKKRFRSHVYAYNLFVGQIPKGLELDHLCFNRPCCNPAHLEAVTHQINVIRWLKISSSEPSPKFRREPREPKKKDGIYCKGGHLQEGDNIVIFRGSNHCRKCLHNFFEANRCNDDAINPY